MSKKGTTIILILFLLPLAKVTAQNRVNVGIGANVGYRASSGTSGLVLSCQVRNQFDFFLGSAGAKFEGVGINGGVNFYPLRNIKWQPFIGGSYLSLSGSRFYMGERGIDRSDYLIPPNNFYVGTIGVRKIIRFDDPSYKSYIAFSVNIHYRYSTKENKVILTDGIYDEGRERNLNKRLGNGFGGSITILYYFGNKKESN